MISYLFPTLNRFLFSGGNPGAKGLNLLLKSNGHVINLGGKTSVPVNAGVSNVRFISLFFVVIFDVFLFLKLENFKNIV